MAARHAGSFPDEQTARAAVLTALAVHRERVEAWAAQLPAVPRWAVRTTAAEPVGALLSDPAGEPQPVADTVVVLVRGAVTGSGGRAADGRTNGDGAAAYGVLTAYPERTPAWQLGQGALLSAGLTAGAGCPYPELEQVALCWLGQDWDADGAAGAAAALAGWAAATPAGTRERAARESALALEEVPAPGLVSLLDDLGVAAPYDDPWDLLVSVQTAA